MQTVDSVYFKTIYQEMEEDHNTKAALDEGVEKHSCQIELRGALRRHVTLGGKSPETVSIAAEATLGMIIVPTTGVFPDKVFCTKCTEEEFVIGQVIRCSGMQFLYVCFF